MLKKFKLLMLLPLLAACSGSPVQTDTVGEPVDQGIQLVEVMSVGGVHISGAEIEGQTTVLTDQFGMAHIKVNPTGRTTLKARAKGFRSKEYEIARPARNADDTRTLVTLDPLS